MYDHIRKNVEEYAQRLVPSLGMELVEVQFREEGGQLVLRVFVDCEQGMTVDRCAEVSRALSDYLDVEDFIDDPYTLEVSSPGVERPLRSRADFEKFVGRKVRLKMMAPVDGQKVFVGNIITAENCDAVALELEDGRCVEFTFEDIKKARLSL